MKLLLDENLSDRIVYRIGDLYPESEHVKTLGLVHTDDALIWKYAKKNNFVIVSIGSIGDYFLNAILVWSHD
jgi:predicted nuclease of predicted toxin-antitoxin system